MNKKIKDSLIIGIIFLLGVITSYMLYDAPTVEESLDHLCKLNGFESYQQTIKLNQGFIINCEVAEWKTNLSLS